MGHYFYDFTHFRGQGRNTEAFLFVFWFKRRGNKLILRLSDLQQTGSWWHIPNLLQQKHMCGFFSVLSLSYIAQGQNYDQKSSTNCTSLFLEIYFKIQQEKSTPSKVLQQFFRQVEILKIRKMTESRPGILQLKEK